MKKVFLSLLVIGTFLFYALHQKSESSAIQAVPVAPQGSSSSNPPPQTPTSSTAGGSGQTTQPAPATSASSSQYKNGTYTGSVADAFYGNVQVQAVITNGRLSDIQFLQYPTDPGHTSEVSSIALPILKQEAIQNQSAQVDAVSGASDTSQAFQQSLQVALQKAQ
ncbi:MAG TPA: FMN-binding protein [Patescibacteria group bacterium]|nr:FMN-binding protein [Patescibacteria group bacterium]